MSASPKVRIMLVDDHEMVRRGVRTVVESHPGWMVCGEAVNGEEAVEMAFKLKPDIIVIDVTMPLLGGIEALKRIKRDMPEAEVIVFTGHSVEDMVHAVFDAGGRSYLLKADASEHMVEAIRAAAEHRPYFTPWVSQIVFQRLLHADGSEERPLAGTQLTPRERETVQLVAEGRSNQEVADHLKVSLRTAESHRAAIMKKLGLKSVGELVRYAIRNNIIEP